MAGRIAQVREIVNADNLARQLASLYNNWYTQRQGKEAEWREVRDYCFATDTTTTSNNTLPWKNKTTIPKLTQLLDNLTANYMDALFPNDNWLRWEGYTQDDVTLSKRKAIEGYIKNKARQGGLRQAIGSCLFDFVIYGNAFAEVVWKNEKYIDKLTGQETVKYIGPAIQRISPYDIVFNPTAAAFKDAPKFTRYIKSIGELKKEMVTRPDLQFDKGAFAKIIETRRSLSGFKMEDVNKSEAYTVDGFGTLFEYYQSDYVELLEFEGDIYDREKDELLENRIITIIDRNYILRNVENPSWLGRDTKEHVGWRDRPDNLYGMGPLDNLVGMQYRLDHLENLKADALDLTIHPPKVIIGDVDPFTWEPGADIHIAEDGDVRTLPPNPAAFQVNNEINYLLMLMEEMAGAPKEAMGIRSPGEKTAFEVQQLQNAAGRIFQHKVNKFEIEFLEPLLNSMLEVARRNMDASDLIRVMDDDLGVTDFLTITKDDITATGKLRPVGARHYATRAQLVQNLSGIFNSPVGQIIGPHISAKKLAAMVEDVLGFEQWDFIADNAAIFEQAETQRLMQQVQQDMQVEAATPVEENMMAPQGA
jgi:hypothetical protein